jgi:hypothetical protein
MMMMMMMMLVGQYLRAGVCEHTRRQNEPTTATVPGDVHGIMVRCCCCCSRRRRRRCVAVTAAAVAGVPRVGFVADAADVAVDVALIAHVRDRALLADLERQRVLARRITNNVGTVDVAALGDKQAQAGRRSARIGIAGDNSGRGGGGGGHDARIRIIGHALIVVTAAAAATVVVIAVPTAAVVGRRHGRGC